MSNKVDLQAARLKPEPGVVETLEMALEKAKAGELRNVALVGRLSGGNMFSGFETDDLFGLIAALELLKWNLLRAAPSEPAKGEQP